MCKFRDLRADEIECRVQSCKENGLVLLLYKDARVDMNILDETVGSANWQREHYECKGNLFCRVGINVAAVKSGGAIDAELWVFKADCGTESYSEAQKGEASDSFKRACFNWGIGRELYTAPFTWIPAEKCNIKNGKCNDKFVVKNIVIEDKKITHLEIYNENKRCVAYSWDQAKGNKPNAPEPLTYETALEVKLAFGDYEGMTLREIWKTDTEYIKWLSENENTSPRILEAIRLINAEIKRVNGR